MTSSWYHHEVATLGGKLVSNSLTLFSKIKQGCYLILSDYVSYSFFCWVRYKSNNCQKRNKFPLAGCSARTQSAERIKKAAWIDAKMYLCACWPCFSLSEKLSKSPGTRLATGSWYSVWAEQTPFDTIAVKRFPLSRRSEQWNCSCVCFSSDQNTNETAPCYTLLTKTRQGGFCEQLDSDVHQGNQ